MHICPDEIYMILMALEQLPFLGSMFSMVRIKMKTFMPGSEKPGGLK